METNKIAVERNKSEKKMSDRMKKRRIIGKREYERGKRRKYEEGNCENLRVL